MFSRSFLRAAAPLKKNARMYASEAATSSGIGAAGYSAIGLGTVAGGYFIYSNYLGKAPPIPGVPQAQKGANTSPQENPSQGVTEAKAFTGGDQGFIPLKLEKTEDLSANTKWLRFALPEADQISGLNVASAVVTKFKASDAEKPTIRPYTPTSDEDEKGHMDFIVKKYPNGPMSEHIHSMKPGETLDVKGPIAKYPMTPNKHDHIAMIAGGTGITPMWQVIRNIFKNPEDKTKITLVFGNVTEQDILLRKELNEIENTYPRRFRAFYVLDNPPEGWEQGKGFITKDLLKTVLPEPKEENIKILVCGPPGLYKAISGTKKSPTDQGELDGALKDLQYNKDQVFKF